MVVLISLFVFGYGIGKQAPFIQVSRSRSLLLLVKPAVFLLAVVLGVLLHLILFAFNALAIPLLSTILGGSESSFSKKQNISALLLVASQKTLPVMVAVVEQLGGALGESGLLVLPCIAAHLNQVILDFFKLFEFAASLLTGKSIICFRSSWTLFCSVTRKGRIYDDHPSPAL
ncbi:hypothetical protein FXO37_07488 [Capsicum annuum]|nr:hypothetical protein FXO37_07488 [Capsicum annuum]